MTTFHLAGQRVISALNIGEVGMKSGAFCIQNDGFYVTNGDSTNRWRFTWTETW